MEERKQNPSTITIIPTKNPDEFEKRLESVQKLFAKFVKRIIDSGIDDDKINASEVHRIK